jgi:hypothetical protein
MESTNELTKYHTQGKKDVITVLEAETELDEGGRQGNLMYLAKRL